MTPPQEGPQYSEGAEMSVLGCMLLSERGASECADLLSEGDFYRPAHRTIFRAMKALLGAAKPIDILMLDEALAAQGELGNVGGGDYLLELSMYPPHASNGAYYAGIVVDRAKLRHASAVARRILRHAQEGGEGAVETILGEASRIEDRLTLGGFAVPEVDTKGLIDRVLYGREGGGRRTFFPSLDGNYCKRRGGFAEEQYTLIQAPSGIGKSTWKLSTIFPALMKGDRCVFATFADLDADEVIYRALRFVSGFAGRLSECVTEGDRKALRDAADRVYSWNWDIYDSSKSHGATTIEGFRSWLLRNCDKHGPPTRVGMDYAQRISTANADMMQHPTARNQYVSEKVRLLAAEVKAAFLVGCQVTPKGDGEFVAKHASDWDENSAMTLLVYRDRFKVKKNRHGVDGVEVLTAWEGGRLVVRERAEGPEV